MLAGFRDNELAKVATAGLFRRVAKHVREGRVGVEDVAAVDDDDGLRDAGQYVFHEAGFGRLYTAAGMADDDSLAQFRIEVAVCAFKGEEPTAAGRHGGMERASGAGANEVRLGLGSAWEQSPEDVFDGSLDPFTIGEAEGLTGFGIGEDDPTVTFEKDENW